ncbi:MAG: gamma-glutamyl-gamma-aminobutyrate hydrolase family protein [Planctomycetes bacterium]|nr:gamma-glutamyl-gamma-aminobutyrate hydrolase family protein [Planctomycetota bacterium]
MHAVVFQHEPHEDAGLFTDALQAAGFTLTTRFRSACAGDVAADLVVALGGTMAAYATTAHPFLAAELAVLHERLQGGRPCLGICLGAQLLARAAGGRALRGAAGTEIGGLPIAWTDAGRADPVLAPTRAELAVAQWHQDTWRDVPGAVPLAESPRYAQQAFRIGPSFAFQFHLELDAARFARWLELDAEGLTAAGHDLAALQATLPALAADDVARAGMVTRLAAHFATIAAPANHAPAAAPHRRSDSGPTRPPSGRT